MRINNTEYSRIRQLDEDVWLVQRDGRLYTVVHTENIDTHKDRLDALVKAGINTTGIIEIDEGRGLIVREHIAGVSAYELVKGAGIKPVLLLQLYDMSEKAENAGYNLDYFPSNFVADDQDRLYYVGDGFSPYMEEWSLESWGIRYWDRTPEFEMYLQEYGQS